MSEYIIAYPAFVESFRTHIKPLVSFDGTNINEQTKLVIFSGGEDISPYFYTKDKKDPLYPRDEVELKALQLCLYYGVKMLGVCRGHQLINAFLGEEDNFIDDIYTKYGKGHPSHHDLTYTKDSIIGRFFDQGVNSLHHQGVTKPGKGLTVTSKFGNVIESTESDKIVTVQFHPEWMYDCGFFAFIKEWSNA